MAITDAEFPIYAGNPQRLDTDYEEGDDTVAGATDYNKHDNEILKHQQQLNNLNTISGAGLSISASIVTYDNNTYTNVQTALDSFQNLAYSTGSNFSGPVILSRDPIVDYEAATKQYVDGATTPNVVKVSATDTTADYLQPKIIAGSNITVTLKNESANEYLEIAAFSGSSISSHDQLTNLNWSSAAHTFDTNLEIGGYYIELSNISTPSTPESTYGKFYVKTVGGSGSQPFFISDTGDVFQVGGWGGGSGGGSSASRLYDLTDIESGLTYDNGFVLQANGTKYYGAQLDHADLDNVGTNTHTQIDSHIVSTSNPHSVTVSQIGAVATTGDESIAGVKTFSSIPILPSTTPTSESQAVRKKYVDDLVTLSVTWKKPVEDKDIYTPPVSPNSGDRYIIPTGASGVWSGQSNNITEYSGGSWTYTSPANGWAVITLDDSKGYVYNTGAGFCWTQFSAQTAYTASNGLTLSSTDFQLGGTLSSDTTITQANYNLTYNLSGIGDFIIQDNGTSRFIVDDTGRIAIGTGAGLSSVQTYIFPQSASYKGLLIKGNSSQSAYLQEWQKADSTSYGYVDSNGYLTFSQTVDQVTTPTILARQISSALITESHTGTDDTFDATYKAYKFTNTSSTSNMRMVTVYIKRDTVLTNTTQSLSLYLYSDNSGQPGTLLTTGNSSIKYGAFTASYVAYYFQLSYALVASTNYWLVFGRSAVPAGGNIYLRTDTTGTNTSAYATTLGSWTLENGSLDCIIYGRTYYGVWARASTMYGIRATSNTSSGIYADSESYIAGEFSSVHNYAIYGYSTYGGGIYGYSSPSVGVYGLSVSNYGVYGRSTSNYGVYGFSSSSFGVAGSSTSSAGVYGVSSSSLGGYFVTTTGICAVQMIVTPTTTNSAQDLMRLYRRTSGTAADGIGSALRFYTENSAGTDLNSHYITYNLTNATNGQERSAYVWYTKMGGAALTERARLEANMFKVTGDITSTGSVNTGTITGSSARFTGNVTTLGGINTGAITGSSLRIIGTSSFGSTVTLSADPSAVLEAATKQYVDTRTGASSSHTHSHSSLNNLTWSTAGHSFDTNVNLNNNSLTTTGGINVGTITGSSIISSIYNCSANNGLSHLLSQFLSGGWYFNIDDDVSPGTYDNSGLYFEPLGTGWSFRISNAPIHTFGIDGSAHFTNNIQVDGTTTISGLTVGGVTIDDPSISLQGIGGSMLLRYKDTESYLELNRDIFLTDKGSSSCFIYFQDSNTFIMSDVNDNMHFQVNGNKYFKFWGYNVIIGDQNNDVSIALGGGTADDATLVWDLSEKRVILDTNNNSACFRIVGADSSNEYADFYVDSNNNLNIDSTGNTILNDILKTNSGSIHKTTRVTSSPYNVLSTDEIIFANTNSGNISINLPTGSDGTHYKIINCGTGSNNVTIYSSGLEKIYGLSTKTISGSNTIDLHYNTIEGWW